MTPAAPLPAHRIDGRRCRAPLPRPSPPKFDTIAVEYLAMFNIYKLQIDLRNTYVRIALLALTLLAVALAGWSGDVPQDPSPLLRSQDISEITALAGQRAGSTTCWWHARCRRRRATSSNSRTRRSCTWSRCPAPRT